MRSDLPTGVVTLLFTDIEGSTRLLAELRTDYIAVLAAHREAIRAASTAHGGVEVDSQGDSLLIAFASPTEAVAAAEDIGRALAAGQVRVRIGLHTGEPALTDEGYVGIDVHRGARIGDAGHGGQILLSAATNALVDADTIDLGPHRLAGIDGEEHLYQLVADGGADDFGPLRTLRASSTLPEPPTSFVGREIELERIDALIDDPDRRLITLVGPGGSGKTRLAIEAARRRWDHRGEPVSFCSVATAADEDGVLHAVADGIGLSLDVAHNAGHPPAEQVCDYLRSRPQTVVIDNYEHVAETGPVLGVIAAGAPGVTLLVTSRRRLELQGEWLVDVKGLDAEPGQDADPAVRLFIERARRSTPSFAVSDDDWSDVRRVCSLVDGMPLGIELAAAWVGTLTAGELAARLEASYDLLQTRSPDVPERHRSLRAAFDGSWQLLDADQRAALATMSTFSGGCTLEAAETIAGASAATVADLVSRSLLSRGADGRFEIHELLRQYAAEALAEAGSTEDAHERHARFYCGLATDLESQLSSPEAPAVRERLHPETSNLRAAFVWAATHWPAAEVEALMHFTAALWTMGVEPVTGECHRAILDAVRAERDPALDRDDDVPLEIVLLPYVAFALSVVDDNERSDQLTASAISPLRAADRTWHVAVCEMVQGINASNRFEDAVAVPLLESARAGFPSDSDWVMRVHLGTWLGWSRLMLDDVPGAREAFEEAYAIALEAGEPLAIAFCQTKLGLLEDQAGHYEAALDRHLGAFASFERLGNPGGIGYSLSRASLTAACLDDRQAALDYAQIGYDAFAEVNHHWGLIVVTGRLAYALLGLDRAEDARVWALHSLELSRSDIRLGQLHALGAVAGAMSRSGDPVRGERLLRALIDDPDMPTMFAIQPRAELALARQRLTDRGLRPDESDDIGLDRVITELLAERHPAPVMR